MSDTETPEEIRGTALGVVVEHYQSDGFRQLTGATAQMRELCELLEERGYGTTVVEDPEWNDVNKPLGDWARKWRATGGHGPAVVLWSGHGVLDDRELRLIVRDTVDPEFDGEVHSANLLASTASLSGADQVLLLIDTCHAGAGVVPSLEKALGRLSQRNLPPGRWAWFGVIASCRPQEKAEAGGVLLDAFARVLREGPRTDEYRHEWSRRNGQVSGSTVIQAVLAEWPAEVGHRPLDAMTGRDRLMFANPLRAAATEPELVEHLVQAARGAAPDDEGWFFSGRRRVLGEITEWLEARRPGLFLVTGSAGSGKSAVLGRIATLSDPEHRADILAHNPLIPEDPDPGEGSVDVALHLRGFTVQQLAEAIARRLSLPRPQTPAALIAEVEKGWPDSRRRLVLVLDGLDEAAPDQAHPVVEQLLAPLSRLSCVLLGSRDRPFRPQQEPGESLDQAVSRLLGIRARAADLDDESDTESDIQEYCRRRLLVRALPMADATTAAGLVARLASPNSGGFLFARMATDSVIRRFSAAGAEGWDWAEAIPSSISAAFTEDLESGPVRERDGAVLPHAAEDLLTALAWSAGNGMPARGVWEAAASALSGDGVEYGPEDVDWLLNEYGRYVVEDSDGTQAVYRLYHREFIAHLQQISQPSDPAYRVARALVELLRGQTADGTVIEKANPYLRRALPVHAFLAQKRGIALVRGLVDSQEEVFSPDLARVLDSLAASWSDAGRWEEALAPSQEATALLRGLVGSDPAAYRPNLAGSLNNLANSQFKAGDRQGALTTITEATALYRELANSNPAAYLPNLAMSLNNLAAFQSGTGDRQGALTTITEATALYRELANNNPAAYLPNLAMSLNNLANSQSETGDRQGALTTITEAVTIRRALATSNPAAYLPDLAASLKSLAEVASGSDTLDAYREARRALSAHPQAARILTVQQAAFQLTLSPELGIRALFSIVRSPQPSGTPDPAAFHAKILLRTYANDDIAGAPRVGRLWREATGSEPPPWLTLPQAALDLAIEWISCRTWAASRAFWDEHAATLRSAETALALEELSLVDAVGALHLDIARAATATGPDEAFRPYLTVEAISTWTGLPSWEESQAYLTEHQETLLHDQALDLLGSDVETAESALHFALVMLARADGVAAAYGCLDSRSALHTRLRQVLASPEAEPGLLRALALLERFAYQEDFTAAAHLALAAALTGSPPAPGTVWPPAEPADRDRVISEIADLIGRRPGHTPVLSALIRSILAASAAP
ncbi:caspase family protein [Streptomyces goshikiensis]|uniref:caspase family protein n=2 Tax=Streptomyces goshikiensis TaxID=1942 RepID=UPI0036C340DF